MNILIDLEGVPKMYFVMIGKQALPSGNIT